MGATSVSSRMEIIMKNALVLYNKNIELLLKYKYILNKDRLLNYTPKYNIIFKHNKILFKNAETLQNKFVFVDECINFKEYIKGPFIFMNEFFIDNIICVRDNFIPRNCFIYLYYENLEIFLEYLQEIDISPILLDNSVYFIFGLEELKYVFSKLSVKFPENYVHVSETVKKELYSFKWEQIETLKIKIDEYYNNRENLNNITKDNFKILLFPEGMGAVYYKQFISALSYGNFKYKVASDINDFSCFLDEYAFLNYLYIYKPDAILGIDLTYSSFQYYLNNKIIIISQLEAHLNLFANTTFLNSIGENTFLLVPFVTLHEQINHEVYNSKIFRDKVICFPFTCNINEYKIYNLNKSEFNKYKSDISVVGFFPRDFETLLSRRYNKLFVQNIKNSVWNSKLDLIFKYMLSKSYDIIKEKGKFVWNIEYFKYIFIEKCKDEEIYFDIPDIEFDTFFKIIYCVTSMAAFRYNVLEWLIEKKYNFSMWGYPAIVGDKFEKYARGYVPHGKELSKVYNASKISIDTNPIFGLHTRLFESISSNCLFLAYKSVSDLSRVDTFFQENKDMVFYASKLELYNKIDYYLNNENKRNQILKSSINTMLDKKLYSDEVITHTLENIISKIQKFYQIL